MRCPKCEGMGKIVIEGTWKRAKCLECKGTGKVPRFLHEQMPWHAVKEYLETEPHHQYRLVGISRNPLDNLDVLVWERMV